MNASVRALDPPGLMARLQNSASRPCDSAGLAAFRCLLGAILLLSVVRFVWRGWVHSLYVAPSFHFKYYGFSWVGAPAEPVIYGVFGALGVAALCLTLGILTRPAALLFCALFTYVELIDQTTYLNHYYLVSLLTLLLGVVRSGGSFAFARSAPGRRVYAGEYWLLRAQVAIVYTYAGIAKLDEDWLLRAEPLRRWLLDFAELPFVGGLFSVAETAYAMSWASAAFDLSVAVLLSFRRTRAFAFATAAVFHGVIALLFPVGVFSWIMLASATVFFEPNWPRRWLERLSRGARSSAANGFPTRLSRLTVTLAVLYLAIQASLPLRHLLYAGPVNWTEEGFRFAWRVMLIEKTAQVEFRVVSGGRTQTVFPRREMTRFQYAQMSTQPDMILQFAHRLAVLHTRSTGKRPQVFADAWASLNGRPSQRYIDPVVNLAAAPRSLRAKSWIVPLVP